MLDVFYFIFVMQICLFGILFLSSFANFMLDRISQNYMRDYHKSQQDE